PALPLTSPNPGLSRAPYFATPPPSQCHAIQSTSPDNMSRLFGDLEGDDGLPGAQRRVAIIVMILGTGMTVLDGSIVNVALPMIARDLQVGPAAAVWIANAYMLAGAMSIVAFA